MPLLAPVRVLIPSMIVLPTLCVVWLTLNVSSLDPSGGTGGGAPIRGTI